MSKNIENFHLQSYNLHRETFAKFLNGNDSLSRTWFDEETIDYWRHWRMYNTITPVLDYYKNSSWVTIGDGRYGLDSVRLKKINNSLNILPTDISPYLLEESKKMGLISDFSIENAEKLSFPDNHFDFAFCKESYHHLPRPFLGLYEMLRVSKEGVVLIEPNDRLTNPPFLLHLISKLVLLKSKILNRMKPHPDAGWFEESGNYCYYLSLREVEKLCIGLQLPCLAYLYFNDYYEEGMEYTNVGKDIAVFNKVKKIVRKEDFKCKVGLKQYQLISVVIFKKMPPEELKKQMKDFGFEVIDLPLNQFL